MNENKEKFSVNLERQLKNWQHKVSEPNSQNKEKGSECLTSYNAETEKLEDLYEEARYRLKLLRMSGGDAWSEVRLGIEKAFSGLKKSVNSALEKF